MGADPTVLVGEADRPGLVRRFCEPRRVLKASAVDHVIRVLEEVDRAVAGGLHAAGFLADEAAPSLEAALATREPGPRPLVWLGLFEGSELVERERLGGPHEIG
jgi:para-aminobenzoate synthetase/4-amino-4-deoxychorismate lyase